MPKRSSGIPERWDKYTPCGEKIEDSPFIAFKVPLNSCLLPKRFKDESENALEAKWTPQLLIKKLPDLVLVLDLTNTNRYYDPSTLNPRIKMKKGTRKKLSNQGNHVDKLVHDGNCDPNIDCDPKSSCDKTKKNDTSISKSIEHNSSEIKYLKIYTQGHAIPNKKVVERFFEAVDESMEKQKDGLIGVHCTHGVNRTGYLICRYLIERLKWKPEDAILGFEKYRGHPIERINYLEDLRKGSWNDKEQLFDQDTQMKIKGIHNVGLSISDKDQCKYLRQKRTRKSSDCNSLNTRIANKSSSHDTNTLSNSDKKCISDNLKASHFDLI